MMMMSEDQNRSDVVVVGCGGGGDDDDDDDDDDQQLLDKSLYYRTFRSLKPRQTQEILTNRLKQSKQFNDDLIDYLRQRSLVEDQYIRSLTDLQSSSSGKRSSIFNLSNQTEPIKQSSDSLYQLNEIIRKELTESIQIQTSARSLISIEPPPTNQISIQPNRSSSVIIRSLSDSDWSDQSELLDNQLEPSIRSLEALQSKPSALIGSSDVISSDLNHTHQSSLSSQQSVDPLSLRLALESYQQKFLETLSNFQSFDHLRLSNTVETLNGLETIRSDLYRDRMQLSDRLAVSILSIDPSQDIIRFASQQAPVPIDQPDSVSDAGCVVATTSHLSSSSHPKSKAHRLVPSTIHSVSTHTPPPQFQTTTTTPSPGPTLSNPSPLQPLVNDSSITHHPTVHSSKPYPQHQTSTSLTSPTSSPSLPSLPNSHHPYHPNSPHIPQLNTPNIIAPIKSTTPESVSNPLNNGSNLPSRKLYVQRQSSTRSISKFSRTGFLSRSSSSKDLRQTKNQAVVQSSTSQNQMMTSNQHSKNQSQPMTMGKLFNKVRISNILNRKTGQNQQQQSQRKSTNRSNSDVRIESSDLVHHRENLDRSSNGSQVGRNSPQPKNHNLYALEQREADPMPTAQQQQNSSNRSTTRLTNFLSSSSASNLLPRRKNNTHKNLEDQGTNVDDQKNKERVVEDSLKQSKRRSIDSEAHSVSKSVVADENLWNERNEKGSSSGISNNNNNSNNNGKGKGSDEPGESRRYVNEDVSEVLSDEHQSSWQSVANRTSGETTDNLSHSGSVMGSFAIKPISSMLEEETEAQRLAAIEKVKNSLLNSSIMTSSTSKSHQSIQAKRSIDSSRISGLGNPVRPNNTVLRGRRAEGKGITMYDKSPNSSALQFFPTEKNSSHTRRAESVDETPGRSHIFQSSSIPSSRVIVGKTQTSFSGKDSKDSSRIGSPQLSLNESQRLSTRNLSSSTTETTTATKTFNPNLYSDVGLSRSLSKVIPSSNSNSNTGPISLIGSRSNSIKSEDTTNLFTNSFLTVDGSQPNHSKNFNSSSKISKNPFLNHSPNSTFSPAFSNTSFSSQQQKHHQQEQQQLEKRLKEKEVNYSHDDDSQIGSTAIDDGGKGMICMGLEEKLNVLMNQGRVEKFMIMGDLKVRIVPALFKPPYSSDQGELILNDFDKIDRRGEKSRRRDYEISFRVKDDERFDKVLFPNGIVKGPSNQGFYKLDLKKLIEAKSDWKRTRTVNSEEEVCVMKYRIYYDMKNGNGEGDENCKWIETYNPIKVHPRWRLKDRLRKEFVISYGVKLQNFRFDDLEFKTTIINDSERLRRMLEEDGLKGFVECQSVPNGKMDSKTGKVIWTLSDQIREYQQKLSSEDDARDEEEMNQDCLEGKIIGRFLSRENDFKTIEFKDDWNTIEVNFKSKVLNHENSSKTSSTLTGVSIISVLKEEELIGKDDYERLSKEEEEEDSNNFKDERIKLLDEIIDNHYYSSKKFLKKKDERLKTDEVEGLKFDDNFESEKVEIYKVDEALKYFRVGKKVLSSGTFLVK
ncbi:expressed protein [Phakopsora pachyrhizi]|uniref:Expressed protein n=1 Tax=Phakopsora pachyrhizi TaxID=170000 RepID=A0AAV0BRX1_PHAPC|nr:expressed protein [Phakopsora pachyrhizi]